MKNSIQLRSKKHRGLAMLELTLVLPVVLMLIMASAEFGRGFWQYNVMTKSVRDASRYASSQGLFGSTGVVVITDALRTEVGNLVVYGNRAGSGAPILPGLNPQAVSLEAPGDGDILVRATYDYTPIFGYLPNFGGGGIATLYTFEATVRMRAI